MMGVLALIFVLTCALYPYTSVECQSPAQTTSPFVINWSLPCAWNELLLHNAWFSLAGFWCRRVVKWSCQPLCEGYPPFNNPYNTKYIYYFYADYPISVITFFIQEATGRPPACILLLVTAPPYLCTDPKQIRCHMDESAARDTLAKLSRASFYLLWHCFSCSWTIPIFYLYIFFPLLLKFHALSASEVATGKLAIVRYLYEFCSEMKLCASTDNHLYLRVQRFWVAVTVGWLVVLCTDSS